MHIPSDRQAIEQYLLAHPASTIPDIRKGLHRLRGWSTEKISSRISEINEYREVISIPTEHDLHLYSLGNYRPNYKLLGVDVDLRLVRNQITTRTKIHAGTEDNHALYLIALEIQTAINDILERRQQEIIDATTVISVLPPTFTQSYDTSIYDLLE